MCQYCACNSGYYYQYPPYQHYGMTYGYPFYGYWYPSYGLPLGYAYTYPTPPMIYATAPQYPRGEHRFGNCLMICQ